jgi:hypothetical protein
MVKVRLARAAVALIGVAGLWACVPTAKPTEYAYPAWGFAAAFPAAPKVTDRPATTQNNHIHNFSAETRQADLYLTAIAYDTSTSDKGADEIMSEVAQAMAKGGTLTQTYTAVGQTVGREIRVEKAGEAGIRMRLFVVGKRFYEVGGQSRLGDKDARIIRFMDSFRLLAK